ncbi:MAG: type II secretion system F family protein [Nanobdellota archaeon]
MANRVFRYIAGKMPKLRDKLIQAEITYSPEDFVKRSFVSSFMLSFVLVIVFGGGLLSSSDIPFSFIVIAFPIVLFIALNYFLRVPDAVLKKKDKEINREIVFATRFLIIETEAGVPLYDCFLNISKTYKSIGKYFSSIVESVNLGTSLEDAVNDVVETCPSRNLQKVLWQVLNTINTGADVSKPLSSVLAQIIREQKIEVEEYGRKLNPMAMFYMMIAVILPSLGTTMLIIFSTFTGFNISLGILLSIAGFVAFVQFMFYAMIKSSRPAVEM